MIVETDDPLGGRPDVADAFVRHVVTDENLDVDIIQACYTLDFEDAGPEVAIVYAANILGPFGWVLWVLQLDPCKVAGPVV